MKSKAFNSLPFHCVPDPEPTQARSDESKLIKIDAESPACRPSLGKMSRKKDFLSLTQQKKKYVRS
jgi:hypothetical protein